MLLKTHGHLPKIGLKEENKYLKEKIDQLMEMMGTTDNVWQNSLSSSQLRIAELKDFIGKHVGITIKERTPRGKPLPGKVSGILSDYKDRAKTGMEKQAWGQEIQEGGNGFRFRFRFRDENTYNVSGFSTGDW